MFHASFAWKLIRLVQLHVLMQIGSDLFFQVSWALLIFYIFMPELINCKVSLFCLLCFPFYTICWRFSILREREEMKSKLSPGACEIKLACLQCAISIISYILLSLQFVTSVCTKTNISMGKKPENSDWRWQGQQWRLHPLSQYDPYRYVGWKTSKAPCLVRLHAPEWPRRSPNFPLEPYRWRVFKTWAAYWTSSWSSSSILLIMRLHLNLTKTHFLTEEFLDQDKSKFHLNESCCLVIGLVLWHFGGIWKSPWLWRFKWTYRLLISPPTSPLCFNHPI